MVVTLIMITLNDNALDKEGCGEKLEYCKTVTVCY